MKRFPGKLPASGFTLVELVMVIVIVGVIAGSVMVFFRPAIDSFFDARRRAAMSDNADTALRRMVREIRAAVPYSIRRHSSECFQFVPTSGGGRYRVAADTVWDAANPASPSAAVEPATVIDRLDVFSAPGVAPAVGDWIVIGNQEEADIYGGASRAAIASLGAPPDASLGVSRLVLTSAFTVPAAARGNFQVVRDSEQVVAFICAGVGTDANGTGTGTLFRVVGTFAGAASCPATAAQPVLASRVSNCSFSDGFNLTGTQQSGVVWIHLELAEAGETAALSFAAHIGNLP